MAACDEEKQGKPQEKDRAFFRNADRDRRNVGFAQRRAGRTLSSAAPRKDALMIRKNSNRPSEIAETARDWSCKMLLIATVALSIGAVAATARAKSIDVVPVVDLNFRFADCQPQERTYDLTKHSTIYYGASIVCQLNVAYISYDRKISISERLINHTQRRRR